jgi:hypothetical protein
MDTSTKWTPAVKTAHHYQGQINGKTYVVPHASLNIYHKGGYAEPMRHSIVTSLHHVQHNNPDLTPEEHTRVHEHIKAIHGGQAPAKLKEEIKITTTPATRKELKAARPMRKGAAERFMKRFAAKTELEKKEQLSESKQKLYNPDGSFRAGVKVTVDGKHGEISHVHHSQEHPTYPHSYKVTDLGANDPYKQTRLRGNTFISHRDIKPLEERALTAAETDKKEDMVHSMKKNLQSFKDRYGADAKSVMYATATKKAKELAERSENFMFTHHPGDPESEDKLKRAKQMLQGTGKKLHVRARLGKDNPNAHEYKNNTRHGHPASNRYQTILKQDAKHFDVYKRPSIHEESHGSNFLDKDRTDAKINRRKSFAAHAKEKRENEAHKDNHHEGPLNESLSAFMKTYKKNEARNEHQANMVHLAKHFGNEADQKEAQFYYDEQKKHGENRHSEAQSKLHRKLWPRAVAKHTYSNYNEEVDAMSQLNETLHAYQVHHNGKHIDTVFYGSHEDPADVKKSLVNHDGYDPGITIKKEKFHHLPVRKNLKEETPSKLPLIRSVLKEMSTRKHFQQVADLIKANPDAKKRQEFANHHATVFAAQNPRFNHELFHKAAGTTYTKS